MRPAFSRVEGGPRTYVQHRIQEHADEVWELLDRGGVIYVCGEASRMAPDVRATFAAIYCRKTGQSAQGAETWLAGLTAENRYLTDVWGGG